MQLDWDEHFQEIVLRSWQEYRSSERHLSRSAATGDGSRLRRSTFDALRHGASATIFLHHFADVVLRARPSFLPATIKDARQLQDWLAQFCFHRGTLNQVNDVTLLGDVADALKHAVLTRRLQVRQVGSMDQVLAVASGFADLPFGEGKFGGIDQVVIRTKDGPRALSTVLLNVVDAWNRAIGLPLSLIDLD